MYINEEKTHPCEYKKHTEHNIDKTRKKSPQHTILKMLSNKENVLKGTGEKNAS